MIPNMSEANSGSKASRRAARKSWPVRKYRLGSEPGDDLSETTTPRERLEMMWPLALEAWALTGQPLPDYTRASTPVRIIRQKTTDQ